MSKLTDNSPRRVGHHGVESWFFRANAPDEPNALWLKATTLGSDDGTHVAEAWCSVFEGDDTLGLKTTTPLEEASFVGEPMTAMVADCEFRLDPRDGVLRGAIDSHRGNLSWDLAFRRVDGALGDPVCLLPTRRLVDAKLPKNKLLTPMPTLTFDGMVVRDGREIVVDGWIGSQGHNWGAAHAVEYAWGQCVFLDAQGSPFCFVEGATGRIEVAGRTSPRLSMLTIRRGGREYRFDRLVDLWRQDARIDFPTWELRMTGRDGEAVIRIDAAPERMVCLGYYNPGGELSYCLNSKTAAVTLRVNPVNEDGFECFSPHGGALEFLQQTPEPTVQPVV